MNEVLIAILVVAGIGLVSGIIIALASKLMAVKQDEKVIKLRNCLPGANCGACGYTGCDGYAKALAKGEKTNLCVPGGDSAAKKIADILGIEAQDVCEKIAHVKCNGHCEATGPKQIYIGMQSCAAASLLFGGSGKCIYGCLGYGDCVEACPQNAICVLDGVARIDISKCIGCGICAKTCPRKIIEMIPDIKYTTVDCSNKEKGAIARKKCTNACIACKKCENSCPNDAIHVIENVAKIDFDKCEDCGICASVCPVGCIRRREENGKYTLEIGA